MLNVWEEIKVSNNLPKDSVMLLSYINTQLRDFYPNLDELCKTLDVDKDELENKLAAIDYRYNAEMNKFV